MSDLPTLQDSLPMRRNSLSKMYVDFGKILLFLKQKSMEDGTCFLIIDSLSYF